MEKNGIGDMQVRPEVMDYSDLQELFEYRVNDTTREKQEQVLQYLCPHSSLQSSLGKEFRSAGEFAGYSEEEVCRQFSRVSCYSQISPYEEMRCVANSTTLSMKRRDIFDLFVEWVCQHPLNVPALGLSPHQQLSCSFEMFLPDFFALAVLQVTYEVFVIVKKNGMSW